jgi:hypothetical protein
VGEIEESIRKATKPSTTYFALGRPKCGNICLAFIGRLVIDNTSQLIVAWIIGKHVGTADDLVAHAIVGNQVLCAIFRILLLPILGAVNVACLTFIFVVTATGSKDAASVVAFLVAASFSVAIYLGIPAFLIRRCVQVTRERRRQSLA